MCEVEVSLTEECGGIFFAPSEFRWTVGETFMSSYTALAASEVAYFVTIYGLQWYLGPKPEGESKQGGDGKAFKLAMCIHNAILCLLSLVMLLGAGYESWVRSSKDGVEWMFCEKPGKKAVAGVYYWSYIYYLSKFLEFIDTVFKVIKRKPLDFLHVYHHSMVAIMCYMWLDTAQSLQTLGLMFNTLVHVFMYYYYAITVYQSPPWWKKYITAGQIIQFQSSFILSIPFLYMQFTRKDGCAGAWAFAGNALFNLSLLGLFMRFSRRTYSAKKKEE